MFINGEVQESCFDRGDQKEVRLSELDNTYLFGLQKISFVDKLFQVPFELEWNHVEVTYESALYILLNFFWHDYTTSLIVEPLMFAREK